MSVRKIPLPFQGMSGHSLECKTEKTAEAGGKPLGRRGKNKMSTGKNKMSVGNSFLPVAGKKCWLEEKIVGWKKKCRLENFPCHSKECPDIPWNARPKKGRGGKKPPRP